MLFSIIVPVYNRPQEVDELLASLCEQTNKDFEVVIVEDGSSLPCEEICKRYTDQLTIRYLTKPNGGPSAARNYGAQYAKGDYLLILDSDIIAPKTYIEEIKRELQREPADAFGGPDAAHPDFSPIQKAISYSMTSFLTTGGIRGGKKKMDKFYPRSFNLGVKREVFEALNGFDTTMRFGEDIDFSIRIFANNYRCRLFQKHGSIINAEAHSVSSSNRCTTPALRVFTCIKNILNPSNWFTFYPLFLRSGCYFCSASASLDYALKINGLRGFR